MAKRTIADLERARSALDAAGRERFDRLFRVDTGTGELTLPETMVPWVEETYGSVDQVTRQEIVKVTNSWTLQTSLFNPFRAQRPQKDGDSDSLADEIYGEGPDPFDEPEQQTSADVFGRVRGEHCVTAGNLAKSDVCHGVVVFDEHNPWQVTEVAFLDAVQVAVQWFDLMHRQEVRAIYPLLIWNCLWKSGASITHAHMQLLLTGTMHYGEIERLRRTAAMYAEQCDSPYFSDLFQVHSDLGLAREASGVRVLAHLTPLLSKECIVLADALSEEFSRTVHRVIMQLHEQMDVSSFNLALIPGPLVETDEDWSVMPVMARIVDRGNPLRRTIDTGALELFAASVISSDPYEVGRMLESLDMLL